MLRAESVLKWTSCDNPERADGCQAVQDKQLAQDQLQKSFSDVRRNWGLELEAGGTEGGSSELQNEGSRRRGCYK